MYTVPARCLDDYYWMLAKEQSNLFPLISLAVRFRETSMEMERIWYGIFL
jgi:hypothetical protein